MTIRRIIRDTCETCSLRTGTGCPVIESCHTDALRLNDGGYPTIAYPGDCDCCSLCQIDCPEGAVVVSAEMPVPHLASC